jgi:hypothetical protein
MGLAGRKLALAIALLTGLTLQTASAQGRRWGSGLRPVKMQRAQRPKVQRNASKPAEKQGKNAAKGAPSGQAVKPAGNGRGLAGLPPKWVDQLRDMSPEEQERFMQNNQRFQSLPPQRQAQIRRNLQKWNTLSPTERDALRDRERVWERMSPEQRQYVQNVLVPKWQSMPPERRQLINGRLHVLQGMTPAQQKEALQDPRFLQGLSPDEQSMLREVYSLRNPSLP